MEEGDGSGEKDRLEKKPVDSPGPNTLTQINSRVKLPSLPPFSRPRVENLSESGQEARQAIWCQCLHSYHTDAKTELDNKKPCELL